MLKNRRIGQIVLGLSLCLIHSCRNAETQTEEKTTTSTTDTAAIAPTLVFSKIKSYGHDTSLFTEGLLIHEGQLLESTGSPDGLQQAKSMIGISDLKTGKFTKKAELDKSKYFGEGIVIMAGKLYQITYKNQKGFIYDAASFKLIDSFSYSNTEGWGMTTNGKELIMSDGTTMLTFIDPQTMKPVKTLKVTDNGMDLPYLNELEYFKGYIYANIWTTNFIVKIDPANGKVVGRIDLSPLMYDARTKKPQVDVMNGIAYDEKADKIYVTGKLWPNIYEISFAH